MTLPAAFAELMTLAHAAATQSKQIEIGCFMPLKRKPRLLTHCDADLVKHYDSVVVQFEKCENLPTFAGFTRLCA